MSVRFSPFFMLEERLFVPAADHLSGADRKGQRLAPRL